MATAKNKKFDIMKIAGAAGGGVAGVMVQNKLMQMETFANKPKLPGLIVTGAGAGLMYFMPQNELMQGIGAGMVATGSASLAAEMLPAMNGFSRVNALNGNMTDQEMNEIIDQVRSEYKAAGYDDFSDLEDEISENDGTE